MRVTLLLLALGGCATLDTLGMSSRCRDSYNACLNTCPDASTPQPGSLDNQQIRPEVAACTFECNERAKACR